MAKAGIEIIYEDGNILVINKPSGVSVTKDRSGKENLLHILQKQLCAQPSNVVVGGRLPDLRLVHRLDKNASGVMLLARNVTTQTTFTTCFSERRVRKTYLAFVRGVPGDKYGLVQAPLAASEKNPKLMTIDQRKGKDAVTEWKLLADFGTVALLAVFPLTGRTHQIRVHLQSIGLPLAVDELYGSKTGLFLSEFKTNYRLGKNQVEKPLIDRLTLHSYQLEFKETFPDVPNYFVARLDKKFAAAIKMLTKHNPNGRAAFLEPDILTDILAAKRLSIL
jgi:RluA family pseudouridine synthase